MGFYLNKAIRRTLVTKMLKKIAAYFGAVILIQFLITSNIVFTGILLSVIILFTDGVDTIQIFLKTLPRDLRAIYVLKKFAFLHARNNKRKKTVPIIFDEKFRLHPQKLALQQEDRQWTFKDLYDYSNAFGNYFHRQGILHGDTVTIMVDNRLEYVALWLGLARIGATSALINFNLRKDALAHCVNVSNSKAIIVVGSLKSAVDEVKSELSDDLKYYTICDDDKSDGESCYTNIDEVMRSGLRLPPPVPKNATYNDKLLFIYTSGTTGLPKAALISHARYFYLATMSHLMLNYKKTDSVYCTLPLYHSNGGIVGIGQCLLHGIPVTIRSKFSASRFWTECKKYNCTVFLYIGEICRYLLAQPPRASDRDHYVRCGTGNGLRPEIWKEFVDRFNVGKIAELYGATEGNANMMNITNVTGSCGFVSVIAPSFYPLSLVEVDEEKELIRDKKGLCVKCKIGTPGMLVGKIVKGNSSREFEGYADKKATAKKIAYGVFEEGDSFFLTGDVLVQDKYGNMYFKDRTGDTFRWKGENVSTAECEAELAKVLDNQFTVAVYGVSIPGTDGKAGMACIEDPEKQVALEKLYEGVCKVLPSYARPIFLRRTNELPMTGTHKLAKSKLKKEQYDVNELDDPVYMIDNKNATYKQVTPEMLEDIRSGKVRV